MRSFSWDYFRLTGDVDAYLLYKDMYLIDHGYDRDTEDEPMDEDEGKLSTV